MKGAYRITCKRLLSGFLAFVLTVVNMPLDLIDVMASSLKGFDVSIQWVNTSSADRIDWNASSGESKNITMQINYSNNSNAESSDIFNPGDIVIKVPGIGDANRNSNIKANAIINGSTDKTWDYTWDSENDIYTFRNIKEIDTHTNFAGMFQISWTMNSREIINEYHKDIEAKLSIEDQYVKTNKITFDFSSDVDTYKLEAESLKLASGEGLADNADDYYWVRYNIVNYTQNKSRGTYDNYYSIELDSDEIMVLPSDGVIQPVEGNRYKFSYNSSTDVIIGYPKDRFEDGSEATHIFKLHGKYMDTTKDVLLTSDEVNISPSMYDFKYDSSGSYIGKDGIGKFTLDKESLYNGLTLGYKFTGSIKYGSAINNKKTRKLRRVASSSNAEYVGIEEFQSPNYLDSLSLEDLLDKDKFEEAVEEAQRLYNENKEAYDAYLEELYEQRQKELEERQEETEEDEFEDDINISEESSSSDESIEETEEDSENNEGSQEKESESISDSESKKEDENTDEESKDEELGNDIKIDIDSSRDSDDIDEKSENDDSLYDDSDIIKDNTEDNKKEIDTQDKVDTHKLSISKKEVRFVTSSLDTSEYKGLPKLNESLQDSENGEATVYIIDDFVEIMDTDGRFVELDEDEYEIASITIPNDRAFINANGFYIKPNVYTVEIYDLNSSSDEPIATQVIDKNAHKIRLKGGISKIAIRIPNLKESLYFLQNGITLEMEFHLDRDKEILKNGYIRNLSGVILCSNGNVSESNQDTYVGEDAQRIYERDVDRYGFGFFRSFHDYEYKSDIVYNDVYVWTSNLEQGKEGYEFIGNFRSNFNNSSNVDGWEVYSLLPEGITIDKEKFDEKKNLVEISNITNGDKLISFPEEFEVEFIENYKDSGRTLIKARYDYTNNKVNMDTQGGSGTFKVPLMIRYEDAEILGTSYQIDVVQLLTDVNKDSVADGTGNNGYDDGTVFEEDVNLWEDINDNGTVDKLVFNSGTLSMTTATATQIELKKTVATPYTFNDFVVNSSDSDILAYFENTYSYRLNILNTGSAAKNVVLQDNLEEHMNSEWKGSFFELDTSRLEELGLNYKVWYSTKESVERFNREDTQDWIEYDKDNLPKVLSDIKAIAIDFGKDQKLKPGKNIYVGIIMLAPCENEALKGKETYNNFSIQFQQGDDIKSLSSNSVHVKLDNPKGTIKITKKDEVNELELYGWEFKLLDDEEQTIATITEDGMVPSIIDAGTYTLKEVKAPVGYEKIEDQKVTLTIDGLNLIIKEPRKTGSVTLHKKDESSGENLSGAVFDLYKDKQIIKEGLSTNADGIIEVDGLEWGDYYFEETKAPSGHYLYGNTRTRFTIDREHLDLTLDIVNRSLGTVELTKYDKDQEGLVVKGAKYELYNSYGKSLDIYETDINGKIVVRDLEWGDYYFIEYESPDGYKLNNSRIDFSITKANVTNIVRVTTTDVEIESSVKIIKTDVDDGSRLKDARFKLMRVIDGEEITVGNYKTDASGTVTIEGLKFGEYKLKETRAPEGYIMDSVERTFTLDGTNAGQCVELEFKNIRKKGYIEITKKDNFGYEVEGAVFDLYKDGNIIESGLTTNTDGIARLGSLNEPVLDWGEYVLKETKAPKGYELDEIEHKFIIDANNVGSVIKIEVINNRQNGSIKLKKYKKNTDELLSGATYSLYSNSGVYVDKKVTDVNGEVLFTDIPWGSYYLQEIEAPTGYAISDEKIRFVVNRDNCHVVQELKAEDEMLETQLKIIKTLANGDDDIYESFGNPSFMFKIEGNDFSGVHHVWHRQVTLSKGQTEAVITLSNIPMSDKDGYKITELNAVKYELQRIESIHHVKSNDIEGYAIADLSEDNTDKMAEVKFTNTLVNYSKCSSTSNVVNMIKKSRKLVYLDVEYTGADDITSLFNNGRFVITDEFLSENLIVSALYDSEDSNGELSRVLSIGEYEISPNTLYGYGSQHDYNIRIDYEEDGVHRSGSFNVSANVKRTVATLTYKNMESPNSGESTENLSYGSTVILGDVKECNGYICNNYKVIVNGGEYKIPFNTTLIINSDSIECGNEIITLDSGVIADVIIEPDWTLEEYTVKLAYHYRKTNGDWVNESRDILTYNINSEVQEYDLSSFSAEGYSYNGLIDIGSNKNIGSTIRIEKGSTGNKSYKLDLEPIEYTLTFLLGNGSIMNELEGGQSSYTFNIEYEDITLPKVERPGYKLISITPNIDTTEKYKPYEHLTNETYRYKWEEMVSEVTGNEFNIAAKKAAGYGENAGTDTVDRTVYGIKVEKGTKIPDNAIIINSNSEYKTGVYMKDNYIHIVSEANKIKFTSLNQMFRNFRSIVDIGDFKEFDFNEEISLHNFCWECNNLQDISALSVLKGKKITDIENAFIWCSKLKNIDALEGFDVSLAKSFSDVFYDTKIEDISVLASWNTDNVDNMHMMFYNTKISNVDALKNWNTSKVTNFKGVFQNCNNLNNIDGLKEWDTSKATNMDSLFRNTSIQDIKGLANWDTSSVISMGSLFNGCKSLTSLDLGIVNGELKHWDTSKVTDMNNIFNDCNNLTDIDELSYWSVDSVTNMEGMFRKCEKLKDTRLLSNWNVSKVTNMKEMFMECKNLTSLSGLANWDTSSLTNLKGTFSWCQNLTSLEGLNNWNVSKVTTMEEAFKYNSMVDIKPLYNWDTSSVVNMALMFTACKNLITIDKHNEENNIEGIQWDTSKVTIMDCMFEQCENLLNIEGLADFKTDSLTSTSNMFYNCFKLMSVAPLENWDTSKVINMARMFKGGHNINNINKIKGWDVSNVDSESGFLGMCGLVGYNYSSTYENPITSWTFTSRPGRWGTGYDTTHNNQVEDNTYIPDK